MGFPVVLCPINLSLQKLLTTKQIIIFRRKASLTNLRLENNMKIYPVLIMLFSFQICVFGQTVKTIQPEILAKGIISTDNVFSSTFTPNGKSLYFTQATLDRSQLKIMVSHLKKGQWSAPVRVDFGGSFRDFDPFITPDGSKLFFNSFRPVTIGGEPTKDSNIWVATKIKTGWSAPEYVPAPANSEFSDFYVSVTSSGTLYFASTRTGGKGGVDLYRSKFADGKYAAPENLIEINTEKTDSNPYIAPDESYLIFNSDRSGGFGETDLYITYNQNGKWTTPQNLGETINTSDAEFCPIVSPDKKYFYFSKINYVGGKQTGENIYKIKIEALKINKN